MQYLNHLGSRVAELSDSEKLEKPYRDFLQAPLQPLSDNLESQTYETFERDPVKYARYEEATRRCLVQQGFAEQGAATCVVTVARRRHYGPR